MNQLPIDMHGEDSSEDGDNSQPNLVRAYYEQLTHEFKHTPWPTIKHRKQQLLALSRLISTNKQALLKAMNQDYGHRSPNQSLISDILSVLDTLHFCRKQLSRIMKSQSRDSGFPARLFGAKAKQHWQALGVIAIQGNWQQPLASALCHAAQALAAGNKVIIAIHPYCPATSECLTRIVLESSLKSTLAVVLNNDVCQQQMQEIPWPLLVDRNGQAPAPAMNHQAQDWIASADGRNHVWVEANSINDDTALRLMAGKLFNAGQHPEAPQVVWVPKTALEEFAQRLEDQAIQLYPSYVKNSDYSAIINEDHYQTLNAAMDAARNDHSDIRIINPADEDFEQTGEYKTLPPSLIVEPSTEWLLSYGHLNGPLLAIKTYEAPSDTAQAPAVEKLTPFCPLLSLYHFGQNTKAALPWTQQLALGQLMQNDLMPTQHAQDVGVGDGSSRLWLRGSEAISQFCRPCGQLSLSRVPLAATAGLLPPYGETAARRLDGMTQA